MKALTETFARLHTAGRRALVVYLTAGDPDVETTVAAALAAVGAGADILEIGIAFSDPVADGPVIQRAMLRALEGGGGFARANQVIAEIRAKSPVPMVAFGYANPFMWDGVDKSCEILRHSGADGLLVVDVPHEEASPWRKAAAQAGLAWVPLVAPTTQLERAARIAASATGFVYMVSMTGVTGGALHNADGLQPMVAAIRKHTRTPICLGFGVRDGATARAAAGVADGVVVGTAIVAQLEEGMSDGSGPKRVATLVQQLRTAIDG